MEVTLLSGHQNRHLHLTEAEDLIVSELKRQHWPVRHWKLANCALHECTGCFGCWVQTPGICVLHDELNEIAQSVIRSDLVIGLTPITFGGFSASLKRATERLIGLILPFFTEINGETHHLPRYPHSPRLLFVGSLEASDPRSERTFRHLITRIGINFHAPISTGTVLTGQQGPEQRASLIKHALERAATP